MGVEFSSWINMLITTYGFYRSHALRGNAYIDWI